MSSFPKMPLGRAQIIAERFIKYLEPFCERISIVGSTRRQCSAVGDLEFVVVAKDEFSLGIAFPMGYPGLTVNGGRLKRFIYPERELQIELYIVVNKADWGRILAIRTGSSFFSHHLAMQWNRKGWAGTDDGLRLKRECDHKGTIWRIKPEYKLAPTLPPAFNTEEEFFAFIGEPYIDPVKRSWVSKEEKYNYAI